MPYVAPPAPSTAHALHGRPLAVPVTVALVLAAFGADATPRRTLGVEVVDSLTTVRPSLPVSRGADPRVVLEAALGEWESVQLVVRGPLEGVSAEAAPLARRGGPSVGPMALPRLQLFAEPLLSLAEASSVDGAAGAWPDPLVPLVDAYVGEPRRAFPFAVPAGEARAIWVEVFVPVVAAPGRYDGEVRVTAAGRAPARIPLELEVHRFALPATPSLPVTWGFDAKAVGRLHGDPDPALPFRYALAALRHRVSLHGGTFDPPPAHGPADAPELDTAAYDAEVGPFLDGTADPAGPADGARWTAIDLRVPWRMPEAARAAYVRALVAHLRTRGWLDRAFAYVFDEPPDRLLPEVRARAAFLARVAPGVPRLVTRPRLPALLGVVDLFCPALDHLDPRPGTARYPPPADYARAHERLWWYQSCLSHGCDIVGQERGWPSLVIDAPPVSHRIQQWRTFALGVGGELYYSAVEAYGRGQDPWISPRLHGGNGDGTLFYPGTPARIGGRTHVPVESIRLKRVRDGLEDYEYLRLHAARHGRATTLALVTALAPHTWTTPRAADLLALRHRLAAELDR